jgi:cell division protein FtsA
MKKNIVITGLDIGSSKIAAVAAQVGRDGTFSVIAHSVQPSGGVARGAVIDIKEAVRSVSGTLNKLKSKVSGSLGDIYVNISGETVRGMLSKGMTPICLRGRRTRQHRISFVRQRDNT